MIKIRLIISKDGSLNTEYDRISTGRIPPHVF